ncbi:ATP binding [Massospora cicadina]|nr:ATP binding [Massospora cicadina]
MEEIISNDLKQTSPDRAPHPIGFTPHRQPTQPSLARVGRSPTLGGTRRLMLNAHRRFSASYGSPVHTPSHVSNRITPKVSHHPSINSPSPSASELEAPTSAPVASTYVGRSEARKAREFNHKISFDALHQHYRTVGRAEGNKPDPNFNPVGVDGDYQPSSQASEASETSSSESLPAVNPPRSLPQVPIQRWSVNQVCYWLREVHLEAHTDTFRRNDVNGEVLLELNHQLLKQLGVHTVGPRVRLLQAVKTLCRTTLLDARPDSVTKKERNQPRPLAVNGAPQGLLHRANSPSSSPRPDGLVANPNLRNGMLLDEPPSFYPLIPSSHALDLSHRFGRGSPPPSPPPLRAGERPSGAIQAAPERDKGLDSEPRHWVRVVGEGGQTRVVDIRNSLHHPQAILAEVLSTFSLPGPPADYAIFVGTGEHTRMLSDKELMEICTSATHPNRDKFILRKRYSPPANGARLPRVSAQRWDRPAAAGWDPVAAAKPVVAGEEVVDAAGYRGNRHSKLFTRRPDSKQIASNLAQYFPAQKLLERGSFPQLSTAQPASPQHESDPVQPPGSELPPTPGWALDSAHVPDAGLSSAPATEEASSASDLPSANRVSPQSPVSGPSNLLSPGLVDGGRGGRVRVSMDMEGWIQGALIGAGSFGSVFLGLHPLMGEVFAVKQVELPEAASRSENRQKADQVGALRGEIALMRELCHPNIVQYLGSSSTEHHLNIFLEYVPGGSVAARLAERGPFSEDLARHYVQQILAGLEYLHRHNIIHRDIKGGNVLIDDKDCAKIADFGVSKKVQDSVLSVITPHRVSLQGSVYWMAPEVVKQTHYTRKADIWSLGCLVIEMLTGDHPFPSFTQMQAIFKIGTFSAPELPPQISPLTRDFLAATLNPKHALRPSSAELLAHPFVNDVPPASPLDADPPTVAAGASPAP